MDPQLAPFFTEVEAAKSDLAAKEAALAQLTVDVDTARARKKTAGETLIKAVRTVYGVEE